MSGDPVVRVAEIFTSVDGEVNGYNGQGQICTFIRLAGCNLACKYCDTVYARDPDCYQLVYTMGALWNRVVTQGPKKLTFTGGEPLLQRDAIVEFLKMWIMGEGYQVTFETNGSIDFRPVQKYGVIVADYKLPSSGMEQAMDMCLLPHLRENDWLKFVIGSDEDFERAVSVMTGRGLKCRVAFSPMMPGMEPRTLLDMMLTRRLFDIHLNVQLHKFLGVK